jgi:hypothetical protein
MAQRTAQLCRTAHRRAVDRVGCVHVYRGACGGDGGAEDDGGVMAKTVSYENYRVVIEPRSLGDFGSVSMSDRLLCSSEQELQRRYRERCHEIAEDVKRHVDNAGLVHVDFDTVATCEHCGHKWTEESSTYNGGCCKKDQEAA